MFEHMFECVKPLRRTPRTQEDNGAMRVEVLHIAECPGWELAVAATREALDGLGLDDIEVESALVRTAADATTTGFAGSPTILVDGTDLFPGPEPVSDLACRVYITEQGIRPAPTRAQIGDALTRRIDSET